MAVQAPSDVASNSMGVTPLPGASSPEARSTRPWTVVASKSNPSVFQTTFTGSLRAIGLTSSSRSPVSPRRYTVR